MFNIQKELYCVGGGLYFRLDGCILEEKGNSLILEKIV